MNLMNNKTGNYKKGGRIRGLYELAMDFSKKCTEDHISAFGAMSAFFILLSMFPFMVLLLTLTKTLPFTKDDILLVLSNALSFEPTSLIVSLVNEIYRKTGTTVFTVSILAALWSSSKGIYSIVRGLNSVYDIEDERNYFVIRAMSALYTVVFAGIIVAMMVLWVFGNSLYDFICDFVPFLASIAKTIIYKRLVVSIIFLTIMFMCIYKFIPARKCRFFRQLPGAVLATFGWLLISRGCAFYMENFSNFTYIYGSMAGIMIILIWLYFCMSMIFYGAEFNYFLENKNNYHKLVRMVQPALRTLKHNRMASLHKQDKEEKMKKKQEKKNRRQEK